MTLGNAAIESRRDVHDRPLDGIRGYAALCVLFAHLSNPAARLDPLWSPPSWLHRLFPAAGAVLLFFVLSGYVIGISTRGTPENGGWRRYLTRRSVRLAPINLIAVAIAAVVGIFPGWRPLIGNLLFTQNELPYGSIRIPVLATNPNLWSLNYEALYYTAFLAVWVFRPKFLGLYIGLLTVGILGWLAPAHFNFIGAYACGAIFWFAGLGLAWTTPATSKAHGSWIVPTILAWITCYGEFLRHDLSRLGWALPVGIWVSPAQLDLLPALVWLIATVARREHRAVTMIAALAVWWTSAHLLWRVVLSDARSQPEWLVLLAILVLAVATLKYRPGLTCFAIGAPFGRIAYALYAIGWPIQFAVSRFFPDVAGTPLT